MYLKMKQGNGSGHLRTQSLNSSFAGADQSMDVEGPEQYDDGV